MMFMLRRKKNYVCICTMYFYDINSWYGWMKLDTNITTANNTISYAYIFNDVYSKKSLCEIKKHSADFMEMLFLIYIVLMPKGLRYSFRENNFFNSYKLLQCV